jgi:hypothetical protein
LQRAFLCATMIQKDRMRMKEWGDPLFCLYYEVNEFGSE